MRSTHFLGIIIPPTTLFGCLASPPLMGCRADWINWLSSCSIYISGSMLSNSSSTCLVTFSCLSSHFVGPFCVAIDLVTASAATSWTCFYCWSITHCEQSQLIISFGSSFGFLPSWGFSYAVLGFCASFSPVILPAGGESVALRGWVTFGYTGFLSPYI